MQNILKITDEKLIFFRNQILLSKSFYIIFIKDSSVGLKVFLQRKQFQKTEKNPIFKV